MSNLFESTQLGQLSLPNRILMAPMTRNRADVDGVPQPIVATYYRQRAGAGLIITEATAVSKQGSGYPLIPGLWTEAQAAGWRPVTEAVHDAGGRIFAQLFHTGRISHSSLVGETPVSASAVTPDGETFTADFSKAPFETPRALETDEIPGLVERFVVAARHAIAAGFDGVEIHAANGYIIDQFLRDGVNQRTDAYGQDRTRLLREIVTAVAEEIGGGRLGVRLSPWTPYNDMRDSDPLGTFRRAAEALRPVGLAYLHVLHTGNEDRTAAETFSLELAEIAGAPLIVNHGYTKELAEVAIARGAAGVAFGVPYLANPDLPNRLAAGAPLNDPDFSTFYGGGEKGYTDYPTLG
ncbi:MAG: alkene reductase [Fimbriimonadaceae bacterium]|nr:alkene reductase [Fimbriimonadaceae bacterium]